MLFRRVWSSTLQKAILKMWVLPGREWGGREWCWVLGAADDLSVAVGQSEILSQGTSTSSPSLSKTWRILENLFLGKGQRDSVPAAW